MSEASSRSPGSPPPAEGARLDWLAIPATVRAIVEQQLGSAVATVASQPTGFSPGVAARRGLADGRPRVAQALGPAPKPPGTPEPPTTRPWPSPKP